MKKDSKKYKKKNQNIKICRLRIGVKKRCGRDRRLYKKEVRRCSTEDN